MKTFYYYRDWHRKQRNPAFIPWHTQACFMVWENTKNEVLRDFIFEMNDWLIKEMQQWDIPGYRDTWGRFYNPSKPYGPPHASSNGVYLEGLIDAFLLAKTVGDTERKELYRTSILRGLRSVMQLQFTDEVDMFYISKRNKVRGGLRTTIYDNVIRVDNIQHNLMAILKILEVFEDGDYKLK